MKKHLLAALSIIGFIIFAFLVMTYGAEARAQEEYSGREVTIILKQIRPFPGPQLPNNAFLMPDGIVHWKLLSGIGSGDYSELVNIFEFIRMHKAKKLIILLNSPGGSLFDGMAIAGLIQEKVKAGLEVEVRGYGIVASAATFILAAGTKGKRFLDPNSLVMIHELSHFEFLSYKSLSTKEKEIAVLRRIQDNVNRMLANLTGMELKKLCQLIKEETWLDPADAIQLGFADKII